MKAHIYSVYFSPTHSTKTITTTFSTALAAQLAIGIKTWDITLPPARTAHHSLNAGDVLVLGFPVYGGRIPLTIEGALRQLKGHNTPAIILAVYGNRHFDDALLEMGDILTQNGFILTGAGAFIAQHSYTAKVGTGRPNQQDLSTVQRFAQDIAPKVPVVWQGGSQPDVLLPGKRPYKARNPAPPRSPLTRSGCTHCGLCAACCPTGAIHAQTPTLADNTKCIACHACVQACPLQLKYFTDETVTRATAMLEENFTTPLHPALFF